MITVIKAPYTSTMLPHTTSFSVVGLSEKSALPSKLISRLTANKNTNKIFRAFSLPAGHTIVTGYRDG